MVSERLDAVRREAPTLLAVLLFFTGANMVVMTALPYITYGVCRDTFPNATADLCLHLNEHPEHVQQVERLSTFLLMAKKMFSTVPPLLLAIFFGAWSDVHGQRLPFLIPFAGIILSAVLFLLAHYLQNVPVTVFIMAGFVVRALSGHHILLHLVSSYHIADLVQSRDILGDDCGGKWKGVEEAGGNSEDEGDFLASMARLQVAESLGGVAGSLLGWAFQKAGGAPLSFGIGAGVLALGVLVVLFVMDFRRAGASSVREKEGGNVLKQCLKKILGMFSCRQVDLDPVLMWGCFLTTFISFACVESREILVPVYMQQPPLSWPNEQFAAYRALFSAVQSVFLFLFAPLLTDGAVVVIGLLCGTVGGLWMAFSFSTWSMMVAGCLAEMLACVFPALRAILTKNVTQAEVGRVLSKLSVAEALSALVGPPVVLELYNYTEDYFQGIAFLATAAVPAALLLVGAVVGVFYQPEVKRWRSEGVSALVPRDASQKPTLTQSLDVPSATVSGYGLFWRSSEW